jgi:hypothetical protein
MDSLLHRLIPFFPFALNHRRLPSPELDPILDNSLKRPFRPFITLLHGQLRKHGLSIVEKAYLLIHGLEWTSYYCARLFRGNAFVDNNGSICRNNNCVTFSLLPLAGH